MDEQLDKKDIIKIGEQRIQFKRLTWLLISIFCFLMAAVYPIVCIVMIQEQIPISILYASVLVILAVVCLLISKTSKYDPLIEGNKELSKKAVTKKKKYHYRDTTPLSNFDRDIINDETLD